MLYADNLFGGCLILKKKIVFLTKEPITKARIKALFYLDDVESLEIVGVFLEEVMHLGLFKYSLRTIKRLFKGNVYWLDIVKSMCGINSNHDLVDKDSSYYKEFLDKFTDRIYRFKNAASLNSILTMKKLLPDLGVVFGHRILPERVFSIPKDGMVNVHYGVLPKYAGMDYCNFWAMVNGEESVGITMHKVDEKPDHGSILAQKLIPISDKKRKILDKEINDIAPEFVMKTLKCYCEGISVVPQNYRERKYWKPPGFFERIKYGKYL